MMNRTAMKHGVVVVLAVLAGVFGVLPCILPVQAAEEPRPASELPEGIRGFSGQVRGVVAEKGEAAFAFRVARVLKVWPGSAAVDLEKLTGATLRVRPKEGELQAAFFHKLAAGQEVTLDIRNTEGNVFVILELNKEQREWAAGGEAEPPHEGTGLPDGAHGFSGMIRGVVVEKGDNVVVFRIGRVVQVWEGSRAPNPNSLVGRTVRIQPGPGELQAAFIHKLTAGQELNLDVRQVEGEVLVIQELTREQRESLK